ncbi:hypothetical protein KQI52_03910 [bacterium]|nr:hypothetical protein [bacterium]
MRGLGAVLAIAMIAVFLYVPRVSASQVDIIESQSWSPNDVMDQNWAFVAITMGHTPTIRPQTDLDTGNFLSACDLLIISSGLIPLTATRQQTIINALNMGIPVYLQCEDNVSLSTNQTWLQIVTWYGSTFTWGTTSTALLQPMQVTGTLSQFPTPVTQFNGFDGGLTGLGGNDIETNLHFQNGEFGWYYYPRVGVVIMAATNTDQDWVRTNSDPILMENYIDNLLNRNVSFLQVRVWSNNPPVIVPSTGGTFTCNANAWNNNFVPMLFDAWTEIQLPNGNIVGPLQQWTNLTLLPFTTSNTLTLSQFLPGFAPAGTYYYHGVVGSLGNFKTNLDALRVVKL